MDITYDQLDYGSCYTIASQYLENAIKSKGAAGSLGAFKIHIEKIYIKRQLNNKEVSFKIDLTPFFIRDILRFSIKEFNNLIYCFYSVKNPSSILEKINRDVAIDHEKIPSDPLSDQKIDSIEQYKFIENLNSMIDEINSIIIYKLKNEVLNIDDLKKFSLPKKDGISIIFETNAKIKKLVNDYDFFKENYSLLIELKNILTSYTKEKKKALDLIAKLESYATNSNEQLTYKTILKRYSKILNSIGKGYEDLYSIFIQSREARKIVIYEWLSLSLPNWPFSTQLFKSLLNKCKSDPAKMKKLSNFLDSYYVSVLSQTSFISSPRRHLLRAIISNLNANKAINSQYYTYIEAFEKSAKKYEKQSSLLLFGFSESDPIKRFQTLNQFLSIYKKVFDDATSLLAALSTNKKNNTLVAGAEMKAIVFYLQYISLRRFDIEKNAMNNLLSVLDEDKKNYYAKKVEEFLQSYTEICTKSKEFIKKMGYDSKEASKDEFKAQRTKAAKSLKNAINKLEHILPIHYQRAKDRYTIYESHTNYKFGPWYDNISSEQIFSAEMLLITAFHMLKKALGEKQSIKEKRANPLYQTPQRLAYLKKREEEFKKTPFFNLTQTKLQNLIDNVDLSYIKLVRLHKQTIQIIDKLLALNQSKNKNSWNDLIFPEDAKLFYHYERDIQDQLGDESRSKQGFTNKQLNTKVYVELNKKRKFQPKITLELEKYTFNFSFNAKDPSKLSIAPSSHSALGKNILAANAFSKEELQQAKFVKDIEFLSFLENAHYELDNLNYYLHKAFCPAIKHNDENQELLYTLLSDATSNEKGLVIFNKELNRHVLSLAPHLPNTKQNVIYADPSINLSKIRKDKDLAERQRIAILQLKRANAFFERNHYALSKVLQMVRSKLL